MVQYDVAHANIGSFGGVLFERRDGVRGIAEKCGEGVSRFVAEATTGAANFSGEHEVYATWSGTDLTFDPPLWRTMGVIEVNSVKLKGQTLTLDCSRHVLVKNHARIELYATPSPIQIDVRLGGADPADVLPKLKDALFYGSLDDALAALPKDRQGSIPARMDESAAVQPDLSKPVCDCAADDREACSAGHRAIGGMVPPKFLKGSDPELPDEVRGRSMDAKVEISLKVDKAGRPQDVWVAKPSGMGFDEAAAKSVLTYELRPAMCHDKPVTAYLNVEVQFRVDPH